MKLWHKQYKSHTSIFLVLAKETNLQRRTTMLETTQERVKVLEEYKSLLTHCAVALEMCLGRPKPDLEKQKQFQMILEKALTFLKSQEGA